MTRRITPIAAAVVLSLSLTACGGGSSDDDASSPVEVPTTTASPAPSTTAAPAPIDESAARIAPEEPADEAAAEPLDVEGIVAAAVLIVSGGDLEAAILDGVISEGEAEAALAAIEDGTLADLLAVD